MHLWTHASKNPQTNECAKLCVHLKPLSDFSCRYYATWAWYGHYRFTMRCYTSSLSSLPSAPWFRLLLIWLIHIYRLVIHLRLSPLIRSPCASFERVPHRRHLSCLRCLCHPLEVFSLPPSRHPRQRTPNGALGQGWLNRAEPSQHRMTWSWPRTTNLVSHY